MLLQLRLFTLLYSNLVMTESGHDGIVMNRYELEGFLANIEKFKLSGLLLVSSVVIATVMSPLAKGYDFHSVRMARCGAAPLGKGPQKTFEDLVGGSAPFTQIWDEFPTHDLTGTINLVSTRSDGDIMHRNKDTISRER